MPIVSIVLAVAALLISGHTVAYAASDLFTSPVDRSGKEFSCFVLNVGVRDIAVLVNIIDLSGDSVSGAQAFTLAPGTGNGFGVGVAVGQPFLYCRITVEQGHRKDVRASYCLRTPPGAIATGCEVTGEAQ
jgi:hypothetical protein